MAYTFSSVHQSSPKLYINITLIGQIRELGGGGVMSLSLGRGETCETSGYKKKTLARIQFNAEH